tara:strand:+ start:1165 stop:2097 length:933 start_codon:yes stop_codon:yes gene_type:complete
MSNLFSSNQTQLFGLDKYISELIFLYKEKSLPNKILLSGQKGIGKCTLAYHFVNYVLSQNEDFKYDEKNFKIDLNNKSFKTIQNRSNPNLISVDVNFEKKSIDINQIRELINNLNKSSFNNKPRFVLIDNIEFLNLNSLNALLKVLEEPNDGVFFILINNNKKVLATLLSRCINFKISLTNKETLEIANFLLDKKSVHNINNDLINYYMSPGYIYNLHKFSIMNDYDLQNISLNDFLKFLIKNKLYLKDNMMNSIFYDLVECYFRKINSILTLDIYNKYTYFLKRISQTKKFNLDEESLLMELEEEVLNG